MGGTNFGGPFGGGPFRPPDVLLSLWETFQKKPNGPSFYWAGTLKLLLSPPSACFFQGKFQLRAGSRSGGVGELGIPDEFDPLLPWGRFPCFCILLEFSDPLLFVVFLSDYGGAGSPLSIMDPPNAHVLFTRKRRIQDYLYQHRFLAALFHRRGQAIPPLFRFFNSVFPRNLPENRFSGQKGILVPCNVAKEWVCFLEGCSVDLLPFVYLFWYNPFKGTWPLPQPSLPFLLGRH